MPIEAFKSAVAPLLAELQASANAHDTDRHMAAYAPPSSGRAYDTPLMSNVRPRYL